MLIERNIERFNYSKSENLDLKPEASRRFERSNKTIEEPGSNRINVQTSCQMYDFNKLSSKNLNNRVTDTYKVQKGVQQRLDELSTKPKMSKPTTQSRNN